MLLGPEDASGVENRVPQNTEIAHGVTADLAERDRLRCRQSWADLILPVGEQKDNDRPRMLLLVRPIRRVRRQIVLGPDDSVVDHIWLRWIFVTGPDDDLITGLINLGPDGTVHTVDLALHSSVVPGETGEGVHVRSHLLVHEVDVLADGIIEAFRHNTLLGLTVTLTGRGERMRVRGPGGCDGSPPSA